MVNTRTHSGSLSDLQADAILDASLANIPQPLGLHMAASQTMNDSLVKSIKLPAFQEDYPESWLRLVEFIFSNNNITRTNEKIYNLITSVPHAIYKSFENFVLSDINIDEKYLRIKDKIKNINKLSLKERVEELLSNEPNNKPMETLNCLKSIFDQTTYANFGNSEHDLLKEILFQKLPRRVRPIVLAQRETLTLDGMAELAQNILDEYEDQENTAVHLVQKNQDNISLKLDIILKRLEDLTYLYHSQDAKLKSLTDDVTLLKIQVQNYPTHLRRADSPRPRSRSRNNEQYNPQGPYCYYHFYYRNSAIRCGGNCTFVGRRNINQANPGNAQ